MRAACPRWTTPTPPVARSWWPRPCTSCWSRRSRAATAPGPGPARSDRARCPRPRRPARPGESPSPSGQAAPPAAPQGGGGRRRPADGPPVGQPFREPFMSRRAARRGSAAAIVRAGLAAGAARASYAALTRRPPGGAATWTRTNHRGEPVTLLEGPAVAAAALTAVALSPGMEPRARAALVAAAIGAGGVGGYDDLAGSGDRRGFRGHLGALARGDVTTGAVKIGGIGATGLTAAALLGGSPVDMAVNAGLTAGAANPLHLFHLRPGRAIKVAMLAGALLAVGTRAGDRSAAVST